MEHERAAVEEEEEEETHFASNGDDDDNDDDDDDNDISCRRATRIIVVVSAAGRRIRWDVFRAPRQASFSKGQSYQSVLAVLPGRKRSAERGCSARQSWPGTCGD